MDLLSAHQTLDPSPQIGKSLEASVKVVPRSLLSDDPEAVLCIVLTNRSPSNKSALGYFDSSCMISQPGTHAIWPTETWDPPLENVKGLSALRRIDTNRVISKF